MRDSCGKKGFFGKDLPCPYDGPPVEVWCQSLFIHEALIRTIPDSQNMTRPAHFWLILVVQNMPKVPSAAQQSKSNRCVIISTKSKASFRPVLHVGTTSVHFSVLSPALPNRPLLSMLPRHRKRRQAKLPFSPSTFLSQKHMGKAFSTVVRTFKSEILMAMPWI